jgi:hypothetical protein
MTAAVTERFEHRPFDYINVAHPRVIYVALASREAFDAIDRPVTDHLQNSRGHVLTKCVEQDGVSVVFQFWLKSLTHAAWRADRERERVEPTPKGENK